MLVIQPSDPSTNFLKEILSQLKQYTGYVDRCLPDAYDATLSLLKNYDNTKTIVFLGHGFSQGIYGGCYVANGRKVLLDLKLGNEYLLGKKIIVLACRSEEFIGSLEESYKVAFGFGNIITSKEDLQNRKDKKKFTLKSIEIFRRDFINVVSASIVEACVHDYSFFQLLNSLKLRSNKYIAKYSLSEDLDERLAGEIFFSFKREMKLRGDVNEKVNG